MVYLEELKEKRKSSLIVVCTLGLATLFMESIRPIWMTNLFAGTSLDKGEVGWILKLFSYTLFGLLTAGVLFIVHLCKVIYYSIEISKRS